jgi:hypothetical protein
MPLSLKKSKAQRVLNFSGMIKLMIEGTMPHRSEAARSVAQWFFIRHGNRRAIGRL